MINFPIWIPDRDSHLFFYFDPSICSTMGFPPLGNSDLVVVSVSIDFPSNSQRDALFYRIAYDCSRADWDGLHDTSHRKYQVKPYSSTWFSATCAAAIVHRNHVFCLNQQNKSSESNVKFRQASNCCKKVLEAAKLAYANKAKESITSLKLGSRDFGRLLIVLPTKVYLLFLMARRCVVFCI